MMTKQYLFNNAVPILFLLVESHESLSRGYFNLLRKAADLTHHNSFSLQGKNCSAGPNCSVCFLENAPLHSFLMFWWVALVIFASDSSNKSIQLLLPRGKQQKQKKKKKNSRARTTPHAGRTPNPNQNRCRSPLVVLCGKKIKLPLYTSQPTIFQTFSSLCLHFSSVGCI